MVHFFNFIVVFVRKMKKNFVVQYSVGVSSRSEFHGVTSWLSDILSVEIRFKINFIIPFSKVVNVPIRVFVHHIDFGLFLL